MKIGVNTLFLIPGEVGGSETYLRDVLRHAVGHHTDVEWVLFTNQENHASFETAYGSVSHVRLWQTGIPARNRVARILREQFQLPWLARRAGIDVLWSPGYTAPAWTTCPQVVSVLDLQYREFPEDFSPLALLATKILVPIAVRVAKRIITLSSFSRDQILKVFAVSPEDVVPIHLAAAQEFGRQKDVQENSSRLTALVPGNDPYILCVANTYPHKNVHTLVRAFGMMKHRAKCRLVLVGGARRGEAMVQAAFDEIGGHDRVIRLESLSRADLVALYQGASVFAFPSLYEGFGLPVLEAMAGGIPVVTTERGPLREIGGDTVSYFDETAAGLATQLDRVLSLSPEARVRIAASEQARAALFTWEKTADATVAVLRSVIKQ